ncbi:hypothetical protein IAT40_002626 [Kwoniella sp. CBS 6097]
MGAECTGHNCLPPTVILRLASEYEGCGSCEEGKADKWTLDHERTINEHRIRRRFEPGLRDIPNELHDFDDDDDDDDSVDYDALYDDNYDYDDDMDPHWDEDFEGDNIMSDGSEYWGEGGWY